jgi:protein-L-isoaspartate(D-aspartate) O-methyltransferase
VTTLLAATGAAACLLLALCSIGSPLLAVAASDPPTPRPTASDDPPAARSARTALVREVEERDPGLSARTLQALRDVPRHRFVPIASIGEAYANVPLPIGHRQTISQPTVVAIMTDALQLTGAERVLEVGTGSGYQAAILGKLAREVYSVEIVPALAAESAARLRALGYANVHVKEGDGYQGWPEHAPFDRILLTAAPPELPQALVAQLRDGGIVVAPLGDDDQHLYRWTKRDGALTRDYLGAVRFVPMVTPSPR